MVAPTMATSEYRNIKGLMTLLEKRNSAHLAPYSPQPRIVEKAKEHRAMAVKIDTQLP